MDNDFKLEDMFTIDPKDPNKISVNVLGETKRSNVPTPSASVNGDNRFIIVCDCDEVLVNISDKWFAKIKEHPILKRYITNYHWQQIQKCNGSVLGRDTYALNEWLEIEDEHLGIFYELYFNDETFYDDLQPSLFMQNLVNETSGEFIKEVYVVSHCGESLTNPASISKARWLKKHFKLFLDSTANTKLPKVDFLFLPNTISKSQILKEKNIQFNTFLDDKVEVIYDIIANTQYDNYEIMFPLYGYNGNMEKEKLVSDYRKTIQPFHNIDTISPTDFIKNFNME